MCPRATARNADGGERERQPRPAAPAPPRTDQGGVARVLGRVYFLAFSEDVCKDVGGRSLTSLQVPPQSLPGPPSVRLRLRVDGVPGPLLQLKLVGTGGQGRARRPPPPRPGPAPHPPPAVGASPARSSAPPRGPSVAFCGRGRPRGRGGHGKPTARTLASPHLSPTYSSCTPMCSSDLLKASTWSFILNMSSPSLLRSVRFGGTEECRVGGVWGSAFF